MSYNIINGMSYIPTYKNDIYKNNYIYNTNKNTNKTSISQFQVPISQDVGFLEVFVFTQRGRFAIPNAVITIYARQENNSIPINNLATETYPITVSLPIAHPLGTLIRGPEYYFTTYDVTVEAVDFAPARINNIRLFEGITTNLNIDMFAIIKGQYPIPENIVNIPPHPRDNVGGQQYT